jgi:hypothetical protein
MAKTYKYTVRVADSKDTFIFFKPLELRTFLYQVGFTPREVVNLLLFGTFKQNQQTNWTLEITEFKWKIRRT